MELVSNSSPCSHGVGLRLNSVEKRSNLILLKLSGYRKHKLVCAKVNPKKGSLQIPNLDCLRLRIHNRRVSLDSLGAAGSFRNIDSRVLSGNYNSYVADGEELVRDVSEKEELIPKILFPGLPDESNGNQSAPVSSFGVGSFHYEKQLKDLGRDYRVWALDFLGQGMSLPVEDPAPKSMKF
ncbi:hypothetical protein RJ641_005012 [Dillenia turbinata]|uniref:Uncharacterized protein n=1 Tax=Dillenia turbinata TaxID=194707 RepID=A0AAN8VG83_9MAGN